MQYKTGLGFGEFKSRVINPQNFISWENSRLKIKQKLLEARHGAELPKLQALFEGRQVRQQVYCGRQLLPKSWNLQYCKNLEDADCNLHLAHLFLDLVPAVAWEIQDARLGQSLVLRADCWFHTMPKGKIEFCWWEKQLLNQVSGLRMSTSTMSNDTLPDAFAQAFTNMQCNAAISTTT